MATIDRRGLTVGDTSPDVGSSDPSPNLAIKTPVRAATTANITLSGEQTIDGVAVVADDRVLVKDQTDSTENGIYLASTGNWARTADLDSVREAVQGTVVFVNSGTINANSAWKISAANPIEPDTTALTFVQFSPSLSTAIATSLALNGAAGALFGSGMVWGVNNQNSLTSFRVTNTSSGTGGTASFTAENNVGSGDFEIWGSNFSNTLFKNRVGIISGSALDGILLTTAGSDTIDLAIANVRAARFETNYSFTVGSVHTSGTSRFVNIDTASVGSGAGGGFQVQDSSASGLIAAFGNVSGVLGGAYDATVLIYSPTSAYRFGGLTAGLLTSSANGTVSVTALGTGVATLLSSFSSANLAAALTDKTGSGAAVFANTPTLITPILGVATATSINGASIDNLAWSTYTPVVTPGVGSLTAYTATGRYKQIGKTVFLETDVVITTVGTASSNMFVTLPISSAAQHYAGVSFDYGSTFKSGAGYINGPIDATKFVTVDSTGTGTFFGASAKIVSSFVYEVP